MASAFASVGVMNIIDSHVHVWDRRPLQRPWIQNNSQLDSSYTPTAHSDAFSDSVRCVYVETGVREVDRLAEMRWVGQLDWPGLAGVVCAPPPRGEGPERYLDAVTDLAPLRGIRIAFDGSGTSVELMKTLVPLLHDRRLVLDALLSTGDLRLPAFITDDVTVVINHLGNPRIGRSVSERWIRGLDSIANHPRVVLKLSGLYSPLGGSVASQAAATPFIQRAIRVLGTERCMFGTDWPVNGARNGPSPQEWLDLVLSFARSPIERQDLAWRTAQSTYNLTEGV
jgi:L-fuconolactonase